MLATCASSENDEFTDPVRLWNPQDGSLIRSFASENIYGRPMALSPDGRIIATGGKSVKLWDARTGVMLRELNGILKRTQSIVFSADGQFIVSGGSYGTTNIWDVSTGKLRLTLFAFPSDSNGSASENWLAYGQEGTFIGSKSIDRYVAWRLGDDFKTAVEKKSESLPTFVRISFHC